MRFRLAPLIIGLLALWIGLTEFAVAQTTGFSYRILVNIENGTGSAITDAAIPIVNSSGVGLIDWTVYDSEGYIQSDGDDIQFVDGANVIYGLAHTPANASDATWVRVQNLANGDTRTVVINTGNPDATSVTVDQGIGLYSNSDTVITLDDSSLDLTDDVVVEVDVQVVDITTEVATIQPLASKWSPAGSGYGFELNPGLAIDEFTWATSGGGTNAQILETASASGNFIIINNSRIRTVAISSAGVIGPALIETVIPNGGNMWADPTMVEVAAGVFAFAYVGVDNDGFISTFTIDSAGDIGASEIDTLEFETVRAISPQISLMAGTTYAVVYRNNTGRGRIATFDIQTDGTIGAATIDAATFDVVGGISNPKLVDVAGTTRAITYHGSSSVGVVVVTIDVGITGTIGARIDDQTIDIDGVTPDIAAVDTDTFAVVYRGADSDGFVSTLDIQSNGTISALTDTLEYDTIGGFEPEILNISGTLWVIVAAQVSAGAGFLTEVTLSDAGTIGGPVDTGEIESRRLDEPEIIRVAGNVYAVVYGSTSNQGLVKTVTILPAGNIQSEALRIEARADDFSLSDDLAVAQATYRMWYTTDGPIFALSKDGTHVVSDNTVSGVLTANALDFTSNPRRNSIIRDVRIISGVGIAYTNLVTNPSVEVDTTGYTAEPDTTLTTATTPVLHGTNSLQAVIVADGDGWYFDITAQTSASTQYTASVSCRVAVGSTNLAGWRLWFSDDPGGGGQVFHSQSNTTLSTTAWTRMTATSILSAGSTFRRIYVQPTTTLGGNTHTLHCDGLQVETGASANTYADGSLGSNFVWDGSAHASTTHVPQTGTDVLTLDFEPANMAQTDAGDSADGFSFEGISTDTSSSVNTTTYVLVFDYSATSSTLFSFEIQAVSSFVGESAEPTPIAVPTPIAPPNYASEGTGSGFAFVFPFVNLIGESTEYTNTVVWYGALAVLSVFVGLIVFLKTQSFWIVYIAVGVVVAAFAVSGATAFWTLIVYGVIGFAAGVSERVST